MTIGVDPHKQTHTAAAVNQLGVELGHKTAPGRPAGNGQLLEWARALAQSGCGRSRNVRNVLGSLERFLIDRGEVVVRLAPQLMAGARRGVRMRGKSDPIDALAIARAALREGVQNLSSARLARPEREIRGIVMLHLAGDVPPPSQMVTRGWLKASHRAIDRERSTALRPYHPHAEPEPVSRGTIIRRRALSPLLRA